MLLTIAALWIGASCVVTLAHLLASLYDSIGGELPVPAMLVIDASRLHIPWVISLVMTLLLIYLDVWRRRSLIMVCAMVSAIGLILVASASISLALPLMKCGVLWPDWPGQDCSRSIVIGD